MKIKVIKSKPNDCQNGISHLVGKIFEVKSKDKETGSVTVISKEFGGTIILNPGEFRVTRQKF